MGLYFDYAPKDWFKNTSCRDGYCKERKFDIDAVYDNDGHLVDQTLAWGTCAVDGRDDVYTSFMKKWTPVGAHVVHWLQQIGLMASKVRNELKLLSQETEVIRDANSSTRLIDFAGTYPQIFDMFWSKFAMYPHSTRIAEQGLVWSAMLSTPKLQ